MFLQTINFVKVSKHIQVDKGLQWEHTKQKLFRQIKVYLRLFWNNQVYSDIFWYNQAYSEIIQAYSEPYVTMVC